MIRYVVSHCQQCESNGTFPAIQEFVAGLRSVPVGKDLVWAEHSCNGVHIVWVACQCWFILVILYVPECISLTFVLVQSCVMDIVILLYHSSNPEKSSSTSIPYQDKVTLLDYFHIDGSMTSPLRRVYLAC